MPVAEVDGQKFGRGNRVLLVEQVDVNIVVGAGGHLGELQLLLPLLQIVDVNNLRVLRGIAAHQGVGQSVGGVQGRQAGNAQQACLPADLHAVPGGVAALGGGGDDIVDLAAFQQGDGVHGAFVDLVHNLHGQAHLGKHHGRAGGGVQLEAHLRELLGDLTDFRLVLVPHGDEHAAALGHLVAGGDQALVQGFFQVVANAQHLAGGLHLRPQVGVHVGELLKGEHRHLHRHIGRGLVQARAKAQVYQLVAQADLGGQIAHGHAGDLTDIGHGAGSPGVHLDDIDLPVHNDVLQVDQPQGVQLPAEGFGGGHDLGAHIVVNVRGRVHGDAVAGVDARALHMLHNAGNEDVLPVADSVHLNLHAGQVLVNQHRVVLLVGEDDGHVLLNVLVAIGDNHVLPAQHIAGPHQHRIAQVPSGGKGLLRGHDGVALGTLDAGTLQQLVEPLPVLGHIDGVGGGAQDGDVVGRQGLGELDGRLAAESHHHADGLLDVDDVQHVLGGQGLKVQPVAGVKVGGHGFRVVVDDDHLIPQLPQGHDTVDAGVVELNALADADGAGAQHDHRLLLPVFPDKLQGLVLAAGFLRVVGGVEIGGVGGELPGAGVHHLKGGLALKLHLAAGQPGNGGIGIAQLLAPGVQLLGQLPLGKLPLVV